MRTLRWSSWTAAALFSLAVVAPFLPQSHSEWEPFALEMTLSSSVEGHARVYYDAGSGFQAADSAMFSVTRGAEAKRYRLGIPAGAYGAFRFDPIDRDGTVTIETACVIDRKGRGIREIDPGEFQAAHQIDAMDHAGGRLKVTMAPGADNPQLLLRFDPPLVLSPPWWSSHFVLLGDWLPPAAIVFAVLAAFLLAWERAPGLSGRIAGAIRRVAARPRLALAAVAAASVIASAYPVVFLGKSLVSPNFGTILLYDEFPTLPGGKEARTVDPHLSDVGAIMWHFVPFTTVQHRSLLRDHEWPLWNRYDSCGSPLLGQGLSMIGDPLHLIPVLADSAAWAWDLKFLLAKGLFALGIGLIVLALTRHLPSAAIVTLAAPFAGFFVYRINHPAFFSLCYAPWVLCCWVRAVQAERPRAFAGWAAGLVFANFVLLNTGTVKEAYTLLLCLNFSGACVLLAAEAPWRARLGKLAGLVWAGILFALFASPVWFTFLETLKTAYTSYNHPGVFQIRPSLLLGAFDEAFYRPLSRLTWVFNPSANFLILGGLLYFLATLRWHFAQRKTMALAASSLVPLAFSFGLVPPSWIVKVPFLGNVVHVDDSFMCPLIILWAVLAGVGFAAAGRLATREGRDDLIVAGLLLFALVFPYIAFTQVVHHNFDDPTVTFVGLRASQSIPLPSFVIGYLATLLAALAAVGLVARRAFLRRNVTPAMAIGFALCATILLWRNGLQASAVGFEDYVVHPPVRLNFHARSPAIRLVQSARPTEPSRAVGLQGNLFPGWSGVYGVEGISGPDALVNPRYRELTNLSALHLLWDWRLYLTRDNLASSRPFLDFLNVRYYLDLRSDQGALGAVLKLDRTGDLDVYESRTAWPRAFFTDRIATYGTAEELMRQISRGDGRPFAAAQADDIAAQPALGRLVGDLAGRTVAPASGYRLTENSTSFEVLAPGPGVVVLSEVWWPGYPHAEMDGRSVRLVRLNHAFEGLVIESAGLHRIIVRYQPAHFSLLLGLSGLALVLMAGSYAAVGRRKPPSAA